MCPPWIPGGPLDPRVMLPLIAMVQYEQHLRDIAIVKKAQRVCRGARTPGHIECARRFVRLAYAQVHTRPTWEAVQSCEEILREKEGENGATTEQ